MGIALVKIKIMPNSPDANIQEIQAKAESIIKEIADKKLGIKFDIEPIAFGLNSITIGFAVDESKEIEPSENKLREIENVSSVEVVDFRRAFG